MMGLSVGGIKGVYAISDEIKAWLKKSYTPIEMKHKVIIFRPYTFRVGQKINISFSGLGLRRWDI